MRDAEPNSEEYGQGELFDVLLERADAYTDDWDPTSEDVGRTLLRIFSNFEREVRTRLSEVPDKQLLAFLDSLNFDRRPPQAARAPVSFDVSSDLDRNVPIPGGTRAIADTTAGETRQFELPRDGGFEATPARPIEIIGVQPERDRIVDHSGVLDGESTTVFEGETLQSHALYLGNETALNLSDGASFTIMLESSGEPDLFEETVWEYYGEDEEGTEGWHRLDAPSVENPADDEVGVEALQERLQESSVGPGATQGNDRVDERTFQLPGQPTVCAVDGIESRWLRCTMRDDSSVPSSMLSAVRIHVASTDREDGLEADMLLSNDVPLSPEDGPIRPFGQVPQPPVTFFVACQEAFTKPHSEVEIEFALADLESESDDGSQATDGDAESDGATQDIGMGVLDGPPQISWEYWNGEGWTRIPSVTDRTDCLQTEGTVQFDVPADVAPTTVSGHENVWIRARLVSGNYGTPAYEPQGDGASTSLVDQPDAPVFDDVTIHYERTNQPFEAIVRYNNASYSENLAGRSEPFSPFVALPDERQTVYFGFDGRLENGPLSLFVPIEDTTYPGSFDPGVQWEYCLDPETDAWEKLDVQDQTGGLTERGVVLLTFPTSTRSFERFDRECHWIRARVTKDAFEVEEDDPAQPTDDELDPSATEPAAVETERTKSPPTIDGICPNTQWAYNKITVDDEVLGSSDGSHDQSYTCSRAPVIDVDVWIDELSTLSTGERSRLAEDHPEDTAAEYDSRGEVTAFWVRWTAVSDFLDCGPQDRHYVVNRTLGTIRFGNGEAGAMPPSGQDNVKATYTTGGGSDGNVDASTITDLKSSIALVDSVANPAPADGGADIESTDKLVARSTNQLKHRNRAVTARDYEEVAKAEFPELARVTCDTEGSTDGRPSIRVLIIPQTEREKPVPSMELKHRVRDALYEHAPASLVADDQADIVVRGPGYSELSVSATVFATNIKSVSLLKTRIERHLDQYLHPLAGNEGEGWTFGDRPTPEDLAEVVRNVDSVSDVLNFEASVDLGNERRPLGVHEGHPKLPEDTLVCSGTHELTVTISEH